MSHLARLRPATHADARAIAEVHVAFWRWAYRGLIPEATLTALSVEDREAGWSEWFADPEPSSGAYVAEVDGAVVGFTGFGPSRDEDANGSVGEVRTLYLLEEWAGGGIGRALFDAAQQRLREFGFRIATLWILESHERGRRFYEMAGWRPDGTVSTQQVECANLPTIRYRIDLS